MAKRLVPWMSSCDIAAGDYWTHAISGALNRADVAIVFMTGSNIGSPWLLYEAGAVAHAVGGGSLVIPVRLRMKLDDVPAPLRQRQCINWDRKGFEDLTFALLSVYTRRASRQRAKRLANSLWPQASLVCNADSKKPYQSAGIDLPADFATYSSSKKKAWVEQSLLVEARWRAAKDFAGFIEDYAEIERRTVDKARESAKKWGILETLNEVLAR